MSEPASGVPARGYTWEPFRPGHTLSMRHGAFSNRKVDPVAAELVDGLLADRPDLAEHPEAVHAWGRAEARCMLVDEWLADHSLVDADGKPAGIAVLIPRFEKLAADLRARLGLDPRSQAELTRQRMDATRSAVDLDAVRERGREARAARETSGG